MSFVFSAVTGRRAVTLRNHRAGTLFASCNFSDMLDAVSAENDRGKNLENFIFCCPEFFSWSVVVMIEHKN